MVRHNHVVINLNDAAIDGFKLLKLFFDDPSVFGKTFGRAAVAAPTVQNKLRLPAVQIVMKYAPLLLES